jgi:hypothetical protein
MPTRRSALFSDPGHRSCKREISLGRRASKRRPKKRSPTLKDVYGGLVSELQPDTGVRGATFAPGGFGPARVHMLGAGWRRAHRLAGALAPACSLETRLDPNLPLDREEKSAIVKSVDANVPPDQPPSTVDSPASQDLRRWLSATGIASVTFTPPLSAQASVTSPGCGVTPSGLT